MLQNFVWEYNDSLTPHFEVSTDVCIQKNFQEKTYVKHHTITYRIPTNSYKNHPHVGTRGEGQILVLTH